MVTAGAAVAGAVVWWLLLPPARRASADVPRALRAGTIDLAPISGGGMFVFRSAL